MANELLPEEEGGPEEMMSRPRTGGGGLYYLDIGGNKVYPGEAGLVRLPGAPMPIKNRLTAEEPPAAPKALKRENELTKVAPPQEVTHGVSAAEHAAAAGAAAGAAAAAGRAARGPGRTEPGGGGEAGGAGGRPASAEAHVPAPARKSLEGLPNKPVKLPNGEYTPKHSDVARKAAEDYMAEAGLPYNPPTKYEPANKGRARAIAKAYDAMEHAPDDPKVRASYEAMIKETMAQWQAIKKTGLKVTFHKEGQADPYAANPRMVQKDVEENNHMYVFPTFAGYGSGDETTAAARATNPLLRDSGEVINGHPAVYNDIFRIVHDYFGHHKEGVGFREHGEDNAWRSHASMYSDLARPAMTSETRGQNSWVNSGPHEEFNKTASGADTIYAPQKMGLLPDWVWKDEFPEKMVIPLSKAEHEHSYSPIIYGNMPAAKPRSKGVSDIAKWIHERSQTALRGMGVKGGRITESSPENDERLARIIAHEVSQSIMRPGKTGGPGKAANWYTSELEEAMRVGELIHPEMKDNPQLKTAYKLGLAITSQGERVKQNTRFSDKVLDYYKKNGRFPTDLNISKKKQINGNFEKLNDLLDAFHGDMGKLEEFLHTEFTPQQIFKDFGYKIHGENADQKVFGSAILGAKIGQGFYQNLRGNYKPTTFDLWFMRGWNRLTGDLYGNPNPEQIREARDRYTETLPAGATPRTQKALIAQAEADLKQHEYDFKHFRRQYDTGIREKTERTLAADRFLESIYGVNQMPRSGGQRIWMRRVVNKAREILAEHGHNISNADLQALWWYPEKDLYAHLGGRGSEDLNMSYSQALQELAREKGHSEDAIAKAVGPSYRRPGSRPAGNEPGGKPGSSR